MGAGVVLLSDTNGDGLINDKDSPYARAITAANGYYVITDAPWRGWLIAIEPLAGYQLTTPKEVIIKPIGDQRVFVVDFGVQAVIRVYMPMLLRP